MMKKSKLSIGLVTSFIGALALTACNDSVTESKESVVDFIGYNSEDEKLTINIDEFYAKYGDSEEGTNLYYNAILESLIRYEYKALSESSASSDTPLKAYSTLEKEADDKVKAQKQNATDNAKSNKTSYSDEWDKILESYDVEDEDELKQYFLYQLEKEAINEWYYKKNADDLKDQYIGVDKNWNAVNDERVDSVYPYHILHVLVKLSADADDYTRAKITESEAKKLWSVVRNLIDDTYTFEQVAYDLSEDSSNTAYGDVGIMSTRTSFYNEFKLGIYAYDALLSGVNTEAGNEHIYKAFGLDKDASVTGTVVNNNGKAEETPLNIDDGINSEMIKNVQNALNGYGLNKGSKLPTIPYDVFRRIGEVAEKDELKNGYDNEAGDVALPRNVLFNQFLNFRSPFVITDEDLTGWATGETADKEVLVTTKSHNFTNPDNSSRSDEFKNNFTLNGTNFRTNAVPSLEGKNILADHEGNVVIGVRSTAGIHFMVMRKSIFKATNERVNKAGAGYTLQDYYTVRDDISSADYPAETYVNMKNAEDPSYYTERINTLKNKFKGSDSSDVFDAAYDYRIYEMLLNDPLVAGKITIVGDELTQSKIAQNIANKIALLREMAALNNDESINNAWETYLAQLHNQNEMRSYEGALVNTTCVFKFDSDPAAFEKDGVCYVK